MSRLFEDAGPLEAENFAMTLSNESGVHQVLVREVLATIGRLGYWMTNTNPEIEVRSEMSRPGENIIKNRVTVLGRTVHYVSIKGHCCPAHVIGTQHSTEGTEVEVPEKGTVHLLVADPDPEENPVYRDWNVPHSTAGEPETYHWQDACNNG